MAAAAASLSFAQAAAEYAAQYYKEVASLRTFIMAAHTPADRAGFLAMVQLLVAARTSSESAVIAYTFPRTCLSMVVAACSTPAQLDTLVESLTSIVAKIEINIEAGRRLAVAARIPLSEETAQDTILMGPDERDTTDPDLIKDGYRGRMLLATRVNSDEHGLNPETNLLNRGFLEPAALKEACEIWRCVRRVLLNRLFPQKGGTEDVATRLLQQTVAAVIAITRHSMYVSLPSVSAKERVALAHPAAPAVDMLGHPHAHSVRLQMLQLQCSLYAGVETSSRQPPETAQLLTELTESIVSLDALPGINVADALCHGTAYHGFDIVFESLRDNTSVAASTPSPTTKTAEVVKTDVVVSPPLPPAIPANAETTKPLRTQTPRTRKELLQAVVSLRRTIRGFVSDISTAQMTQEDGFDPISDAAFVQILSRVCLDNCKKESHAAAGKGSSVKQVKTRADLERAVETLTFEAMMQAAAAEGSSTDKIIGGVVMMHALNAKTAEGEPTLGPSLIKRALLELDKVLI